MATKKKLNTVITICGLSVVGIMFYRAWSTGNDLFPFGYEPHFDNAVLYELFYEPYRRRRGFVVFVRSFLNSKKVHLI